MRRIERSEREWWHGSDVTQIHPDRFWVILWVLPRRFVRKRSPEAHRKPKSVGMLVFCCLLWGYFLSTGHGYPGKRQEKKASEI